MFFAAAHELFVVRQHAWRGASAGRSTAKFPGAILRYGACTSMCNDPRGPCVIQKTGDQSIVTVDKSLVMTTERVRIELWPGN